jgi:3-deoxy-manno-octulosonate cytidylyltransferase (CMP-KDO synthetase)
MKVAAVIPARYQSSRFPGKPLAPIAGRTMIERVYFQALQAECFAEIVVATDDQRIFDEVRRFGGNAEMTDNNINSGTERVWAIAEKRDFEAVVNIQGDEPLVPPALLRSLALALAEDPLVSAARHNDSYDDFLSANVVKVVCDGRDRAVYFSRAPIPFADREAFDGFWQHIGIYGYTREMLGHFIEWGPTALEQREKLEQLRFLFMGRSMRILRTNFVSHGVDVPGDVEKIEEILRS